MFRESESGYISIFQAGYGGALQTDGISEYAMDFNGIIGGWQSGYDDPIGQAAGPSDPYYALEIVELGGKDYLYQSSYNGDQVGIFLVNEFGNLVNFGEMPHQNASGTPRNDILHVEADNTDYLIIASGNNSGTGQAALEFYTIYQDGHFFFTTSGSIIVPSDDPSYEFHGARALATETIDGKSFVFVLGSAVDLVNNQFVDNTTISVFELFEGDLIQTDVATDSDDLAYNLLGNGDITSATVDGTAYIFASGPDDKGISVFSVDSAGLLTSVFNISDAPNLYLDDIREIDTVSFGGETFLLVTSLTESAVSLFHIAADGSLTLTDAIGDDATTNIDGVHQLDTIISNGSVFLVASGGTEGFSVFEFGGGDDVLAGGEDDDIIIGLAGDDTLSGNAGADELRGGAGNDLLTGGSGTDSYFGGTGSDTVSFLGAAGWIIDLAVGTATTLSGATMETITSIENAIGSGGNDTIRGTVDANDLDGGKGDDLLIGGGGVDNFAGGAGTDTVDISGSTSKWKVDLANDEATITAISGTVDTVDFASIENVIGANNTMTVLGTSGNETVTGQNFSDIFYVGGGVDQFDAGLGFDTIGLGSHTEGLTVRGTSGWVKTASGTVVATFTSVENFSGTSYNDDMTGTAGRNILDGRSGNDTLNAGRGNDTVRGGLGDDQLHGGAGNDELDGGTGNDVLIGGSGVDSYDGGLGSDTVSFIGSAGWVIDLVAGTATTLTGGTTETITSVENVVGSSGNDTIRGTVYSNDLDGGGGDDMLIGGGGVDDFYGGAGSDTVDLSGSNSAWRVDLVDESATLTALSGTVYSVDFTSIENIIGASNTMTVFGTNGNETVTGQSFSDIFYVGGGIDQFDAGLGFDTISFGSHTEGLTVRGTSGWAETPGGTRVTTFTGVESLLGTSYDDDMTGTSGTNILDGRSGDDTLSSGAGDDTVRGGLGNDHLTGGSGNDTIDGGGDTDYAYFDGVRADYSVVKSGSTTTVSWIGPGAGDGTDTLTNIEFLGFDDGFFYV